MQNEAQEEDLSLKSNGENNNVHLDSYVLEI